MSKIYYDNDWRRAILQKEKTQLYNAVVEIGKYLNKYPKDKMAIGSYIRMLIKVGRIDDAEEQLQKFEELIEESRTSGKESTENVDKDENLLRLYQFMIFCWKQKYEEAMKYYIENMDSIEKNEYGIELMVLFCKYQLGTLPPLAEPSDFKNEYKAKQIMNYDENELFEHIRNSYVSPSEYTPPENAGKSYFNSNFPYEREGSIYPSIKEIIEKNKDLTDQEAKRINYNFPIVQYIFKYPGCGVSDCEIVDFFIVEVIVGTSNIVKMYPSTDCQNLPYFDLTHMLPLSIKGNHPTRANRRTWRFNTKYGLK